MQDADCVIGQFRVKGLGFPPTVTKVGQGAMMLGACND